MMMKIFLITFLISSSTLNAQDWTGISDCGQYKVSGVVRLIKGLGLKIYVNEKTQSEIIISTQISNQPMLAPYVDKDITAYVSFDKKLTGSVVTGNVEEIKRRFPNPLNPKDTGVQITTKKECGH